MSLWHYTCGHVAYEIKRSAGVLKPMPQPALAGAPSLVWLTDLDHADAETLALTGHLLHCDRTETRWEVRHPNRVVHWAEYRMLLPVEEVEVLEEVGEPEHWFVSHYRQRARIAPDQDFSSTIFPS